MRISSSLVSLALYLSFAAAAVIQGNGDIISHNEVGHVERTTLISPRDFPVKVTRSTICSPFVWGYFEVTFSGGPQYVF